MKTSTDNDPLKPLGKVTLVLVHSYNADTGKSVSRLKTLA
jgi:hypothetical protein